MMKSFLTTCLAVLLWSCAISHAQVPLVKDGQPVAAIITDFTAANDDKALHEASALLADRIQRFTGPAPVIHVQNDDPSVVAPDMKDKPAVILAIANQHARIAEQAGHNFNHPDAFTIVTTSHHLYILGNSAQGITHGVAALLIELGFHQYAPSPRWLVTPKGNDLIANINTTSTPALRGRGIWYAYGTGGDKNLGEQYKTWAIANRLPSAAPFHTGHSYGNIIQRNQAAFEAHPEYFALLEDGARDNKRGFNARKFCVSNPGLIKLVIEDRIKLLEQNKARNRFEFMVSVDPSDGQGFCHCENCAKIGTTTDRVVHLANHVAKALREKHPDAWVGMYAYSSHRLPPTIAVEPNVYVQVAMGFNRTQYSLPELVGKWAEKTSAIGLREYYGVEAWDWGFPGRMRGAQADYHAQWIPYYTQRKLNAINAETNANWAGQTPGLYIASRLMWDTATNVQQLQKTFYTTAYGKAASVMQAFHEKLDAAPQLQPENLTPILDDLAAAYELAKDDQPVRDRIIDMMAYMHYVVLSRDFEVVQSRSAQRGDDFYAALKPLMEYTWRIRSRDIVHYYALARRLCNGLPLTDGRFEFWMNLKGPKSIAESHIKNHPSVNIEALPESPVWMTGEPYTDEQIIDLFNQDRKKLAGDNEVAVFFTRYFDFGLASGPDAGPARTPGTPIQGSAAVTGTTTLHFAPATITTHDLHVLPRRGCVKVTAYSRGEDVMFEQTITPADIHDNQPATLTLPMPRPGEYRVVVTGDAILHTTPDVPMVYEASPAAPLSLVDTGPLYFYVPRGIRNLMFNTTGSITLQPPGGARPITFTPANRADGQNHITIPIDAAAAGKVWQVHTTAAQNPAVSQGAFWLVNAPPFLWTYRKMVIVPRETSMADSLTTFPGEENQ